MNDLSFWQSVQLLAIEAIVAPDWEAFYRRVCRWYSQTFSTPLTEVYDLPTTWVLQNYYEQTWGELEREELLEKLDFLLETPEERLAKAAQAKKSEAQKVAVAEDFAAKVKKRMEEGAMRLDRAADRLGKLVKKQKPKDLEELRKQLLSIDDVPAPKPKEPEKMPSGAMPAYEFSVGGEPPDDDEDPLARAFPKKPAR